MGKRSNFDRVPKDLYRTTDPRAVAALLPFLAPNTNFVEPCAGHMDLVWSLRAAGHVPNWASDIQCREVTSIVSGVPVITYVPAIDALTLTTPLTLSDCIITNPPFSKEALFPMISHFRKFNKAWLLLPADFMHNKQSCDAMRHCSLIVPIGRLKWFEGTKHGSTDNYCWFLFEQKPCTTVFIPRASKAASKTQDCHE